MDYRNKFMMMRRLLLMTFIGIGLGFIIHFATKKNTPEIPKKIVKIIDTVKIEEFSEANLGHMMYILDIEYPDIVMAQAKLETGNFTSNRFKKYNALFGFQTSNKNIIKYKSWKESIIHYSHWQMRRLEDGEDYYKFLVRIGYAQDSLYIVKLKQIVKCQK